MTFFRRETVLKVIFVAIDTRQQDDTNDPYYQQLRQAIFNGKLETIYRNIQGIRMDILPGMTAIQYQPAGTKFLQPETCTHEIGPLRPGMRARYLFHPLATDDRNADEARHFGHIIIPQRTILMVENKRIINAWRAKIFINTTPSAVIVSPNNLRTKFVVTLLDPDAENCRGEPAAHFYKPPIFKAAQNYVDIVSKIIHIPPDLLGYPNT